jgi:threonyl-tRNA synthetase
MVIKACLPGDIVEEFPNGSVGLDIARALQFRLGYAIVAFRVGDRVWDLGSQPPPDAQIELVTEQAPEALEILRHSAAHVMAQAVQRLFPGTKLAIGPPTKEGFYYDFDPPQTFTDNDLWKIEQEMQNIIQQDIPFVRQEVPKQEAIEMMKGLGEIYKLEILQDIPEEKVSFYRNRGFIDLCAGPHLPSTGLVRCFKLLKATGAYWRGDERNKMLQRIYGTAFFSVKDLELHLTKVEEAKKRDHRKLGKELDLFSVHSEVGGGLIHWHPKGGIVRKIIEDLWYRWHTRHGYQLVYTPHICSEEIYKLSGHLEFYSDLMYAPLDIEGRPYRVKPMNCPGHIMIYNTRLRSYRELPVRYAEMGTVYRFEKSGVLYGLLRVRGFTIDDAHIFCTPAQLEQEVLGVLRSSMDFLRMFGFSEFEITLATRPDRAIGSAEDWDRAIHALRHGLEGAQIGYIIEEKGGAFYGPKISINVKDCMGHSWQTSTVQFDFNLPERFNITYVAEDGTRKRPYMVHRALLGSVERFFGALIEHYGGDFPIWLTPVQVMVIPVTQKEHTYAHDVFKILISRGIRAEIDLRDQRISYKIRQATLQKIPYMLIVGEREVVEGDVAVRCKRRGDLGGSKLDEFIERLEDEVRGSEVMLD